MSRIARIVAVGVPHHITQRGNRRLQVFFSDADYHAYLDLLREWSARAELALWAYCLMPNHVHIIAVPTHETSLHIALKETHRRYSCRVNLREGWRGYLWQGRFSSFPMDEVHAYHALRYVEANPVRAGLADTPAAWPWSSAAARLNAANVAVCPTVFPATYQTAVENIDSTVLGDTLLHHEKTGRPLGTKPFIKYLENKYHRLFTPQKRGPKPKQKSSDDNIQESLI